MMNMPPSLARALSALLLLAVLLLFLLVSFPLPEELGAIDFRPYWSASYLFARGLDFGDLQALDQVERSLTGWQGAFTMQAWFTPLGHLILAPLTFFPFQPAAKTWLLINILCFSITAWLLSEELNRLRWVALLVTFSFSATLTALFFGQVNSLTLLGLALFLFFERKGKEFWAGISLVLTLVKPHLVVLTLPTLILYLVWHKKWRALSGFGLALVLVSLFLFLNVSSG